MVFNMLVIKQQSTVTPERRSEPTIPQLTALSGFWVRTQGMGTLGGP